MTIKELQIYTFEQMVAIYDEFVNTDIDEMAAKMGELIDRYDYAASACKVFDLSKNKKG